MKIYYELEANCTYAIAGIMQLLLKQKNFKLFNTKLVVSLSSNFFYHLDK